MHYAQNLASKIDHTILKATATIADIERLCTEAIQYQFAAVCVPPYYVNTAAEYLQNTAINVATVIGFPLGYSSSYSKQSGMAAAIKGGAKELDVVVNIAAIKSGNWDFVSKEVETLTAFAHKNGAIIKLIFETAYLTKDEIIRLCAICTAQKVDFAKTSTGFAPTGATVEIVSLMRNCLPLSVQIKASGGIRTAAASQAMLNAGANRLGCSSSIQIVSL